MKKELLTVEFRYHDKPKGNHDGGYRSKTVTIGIYDTLEDAIKEGNKVLNTLSENFEVRVDDKFMLKHLFGTPKRLVTNCCYPSHGIQYFAKIETLKFDDVDAVVSETFAAFDRYKEFKLSEQD